jgi:hypothetical protein
MMFRSAELSGGIQGHEYSILALRIDSSIHADGLGAHRNEWLDACLVPWFGLSCFAKEVLERGKNGTKKLRNLAALVSIQPRQFASY